MAKATGRKGASRRPWTDAQIEASGITSNAISRGLIEILRVAGVTPRSEASRPSDKCRALVAQLKEVVKSLKGASLDDVVVSLREHGYDISEEEEKTPAKLSKAIDGVVEVERRSLSDFDDLSPNKFKSVLLEIITKYTYNDEDTVIDARQLFREALDMVQEQEGLRRINVVESNFFRMHGYLDELIDTYQGFRWYGVGNRLTTARVVITGLGPDD